MLSETSISRAQSRYHSVYIFAHPENSEEINSVKLGLESKGITITDSLDQAYSLIVLVTPELFECRGGYIVEAFRYCYRYSTNIILLLLHSSVLRQYNWCGPIAVLLKTVPVSCVFDFSKN